MFKKLLLLFLVSNAHAEFLMTKKVGDRYEIIKDEQDKTAKEIYEKVLSIYQWPMLNYAYHTHFTEQEKQEVQAYFRTHKEYPLHELIKKKVSEVNPGYSVQWIPTTIFQLYAFKLEKNPENFFKIGAIDRAIQAQTTHEEVFEKLTEMNRSRYAAHIKTQKLISSDMKGKEKFSELINTENLKLLDIEATLYSLPHKYQDNDKNNAIQRAIKIEEEAEKTGDFLLFRGTAGFPEKKISDKYILDSSSRSNTSISQELHRNASKHYQHKETLLKKRKPKETNDKRDEQLKKYNNPNPEETSKQQSLSYGNTLLDGSMYEAKLVKDKGARAFDYIIGNNQAYFLRIPIIEYLKQDLKKQLFFITPWNTIVGLCFDGEHHPRSKWIISKEEVTGYVGDASKHRFLHIDEQNLDRLALRMDRFIREHAHAFYEDAAEGSFKNSILGLKELNQYQGYKEYLKKDVPTVDNDALQLKHDNAFEEPQKRVNKLEESDAEKQNPSRNKAGESKEAKY